MPDFRRQRDTARNEAERLRREVNDLRAILGELDPAYASAFHDLCDIAIHGLRRPDDLGGTITTGHAESRPPAHHAAAYNARNAERRYQRQRADRLRHLIDALDEGRAPCPPQTRTTQTPVLAQPSQNGHSPTRSYGNLSLSFRRAPIGAPNTEPT